MLLRNPRCIEVRSPARERAGRKLLGVLASVELSRGVREHRLNILDAAASPSSRHLCWHMFEFIVASSVKTGLKFGRLYSFSTCA
jgi:hypothetical protein